MKNGKVIVGRLKLVERDTLNPILDSYGNPITKPNIISDPNYIPPYYDSSICGDVVPQPTTTLNPCDNIITGYAMSCDNPIFGVLHVTFNFLIPSIVNLVIYKNNVQVYDAGSTQVVSGNAYINVPKTIVGDVILRFTVNGCVKEFLFTVPCIDVTTTQPPATTTQPPATTTQPPVTTTVNPVVSGLFSILETACADAVTTTSAPCNATFNLIVLNDCDSYGAYTVQVTILSGAPSAPQYGWSLTNDVTTVTNWSNSSLMAVLGTGVIRYFFVRYNSNTCTQLVGSSVKSCTQPTTTLAPTTTTPPVTTTGAPTTTPIPTTTVAPVTTTPAPTTTLPPCAGAVLAGGVSAPDTTHITVTLTSPPAAVFYKIKIGSTVVAGGSIPTPTAGAQTFAITGYTMVDNTSYDVYFFGANCADGLAHTFLFCDRPTTTVNAGTTSWNGTTFTSLADIQNYVTNVGGEAKTSQDLYFADTSMTVGSAVYSGSTGCSRAADVWAYFEAPMQNAHIPFVCGHYAIHIVSGVIATKTLISC